MEAASGNSEGSSRAEPTTPEELRRRLDELVASAGLCWAADRRNAAVLLLEQALDVARDLAGALPTEGAPAARLVETLRPGRGRERALETLSASLDGADLADPKVFGATTRTLRRVADGVRLLDPRARRRRRIAWALGGVLGAATAVAIVLTILANVDKPEDRTFGGTGGRAFEVSCPRGTRVVGADVFVSGSLIAGILPRCLAPSATTTATQPTTGRMIGGRSPNVQEIRCAPGMIAVGITGRAGARVDRFSLLCAPHQDPESETHELRGIGGTGGSYYRSRCSEGSVAGFRGTAGAVVDSVGVVCVEDDDL